MTALEQAVVGSRVLEPGSHISQSVKSGWPRTYVRRLAATDAAAIIASVAIAQLVRFGTAMPNFGSIGGDKNQLDAVDSVRRACDEPSAGPVMHDQERVGRHGRCFG